jgi:hypothetical protein
LHIGERNGKRQPVLADSEDSALIVACAPPGSEWGAALLGGCIVKRFSAVSGPVSGLLVSVRV